MAQVGLQCSGIDALIGHREFSSSRQTWRADLAPRSVRRNYLFRLNKFPKAKTMKRNPALESASVRIVSLAIPNPSWATAADMAAIGTAITNHKMGMTTRPM
jgi:hypothetical protein